MSTLTKEFAGRKRAILISLNNILFNNFFKQKNLGKNLSFKKYTKIKN